MKKPILILLFLLLGSSARLAAQEQEAEQLLLNVEKLAQLKQLLSDMKKGYTIISTGYTTVKNISQGNFNLHQTFLDGLLAVSPTVRKYQKVTDIINYQVLLVKEYKYALKRFKQAGHFNPAEINYLNRVYANLFNQSLQNLDALTTILTANKLRMADEERLRAIDQIFADMQDKLQFLRHFNNATILLAVQRAGEQKDVRTMQQIYGITD
jgi:hypothetical protein